MLAAKIKSVVDTRRGTIVKSPNSYEDAVSEISTAATSGLQSCTIRGCLSDDIISQLLIGGFVVELQAINDSVRNNATFISWK